MTHKLDPSQYDSVEALFEGLRFHLASAAVLDGGSPGWVYVDDRWQPQSAFMLSPEGCYLVGRADNETFNRDLNQAIVSRHILSPDVSYLCVIVHPGDWRAALPTLFAPHIPVEEKRRHYVCRDLGCDWRAGLPESYRVQRIDHRLLQDDCVMVPDHVTDWMENNWGSIDRFLQHGFGWVSMTGDEVVSWSLSDCVTGDRCEIGIHTAPAHRRRGLATITAAATVEHALDTGFSEVGWHCPEDNVGSIGTAEKVGFERERNYSAYYVFFEGQA